MCLSKARYTNLFLMGMPAAISGAYIDRFADRLTACGAAASNRGTDELTHAGMQRLELHTTCSVSVHLFRGAVNQALNKGGRVLHSSRAAGCTLAKGGHGKSRRHLCFIGTFQLPQKLGDCPATARTLTCARAVAERAAAALAAASARRALFTWGC